jgi:hypothetical protein
MIKALKPSRQIIFSVIAGCSISTSILINPIQSAETIFELKKHHEVNKILDYMTFDGMVVDTQLMGGVVAGLGRSSYSHVIPIPSKSLDNSIVFSYYKSLLQEDIYRSTLDRWLHIKSSLNDKGMKPVFADAISIYVFDFISKEKVRDYSFANEKLTCDLINGKKSYAITNDGKHFSGWYLFEEFDYMNANVTVQYSCADCQVLKSNILQRIDVARTFNTKQGMYSGFDFEFSKPVDFLMLKHQNSCIVLK